MRNESLLRLEEHALGNPRLVLEVYNAGFVGRQDGLDLVEPAIFFEQGADDGLSLGAFALIIACCVGLLNGLAQELEVSAGNVRGRLLRLDINSTYLKSRTYQNVVHSLPGHLARSQGKTDISAVD